MRGSRSFKFLFVLFVVGMMILAACGGTAPQPAAPAAEEAPAAERSPC
ncbi:MAG: hypothetical protein HC914_18980 [Chloroflexaceae bacterium]|nr:hypothetical protein [Chloroflexaceae bacterium]